MKFRNPSRRAHTGSSGNGGLHDTNSLRTSLLTSDDEAEEAGGTGVAERAVGLSWEHEDEDEEEEEGDEGTGWNIHGSNLKFRQH